MAVVEGVSAGFVIVAPSADPTGGSRQTADANMALSKHTSPSGSVKIIEIGWWCDVATEAANFEVGVYAADGAVVPGEAGTLLHVSRTNAKGTTSGWKVVSGLDWSIDASTAYWLGLQVDNTASITRVDIEITGGNGRDTVQSVSTMPNPAGGGSPFDPDGIVAIYAVYETAAGTNTQINIGDAWKEIAGVQINIGDTWKTVEGMQINIGDAWKTIF